MGIFANTQLKLSLASCCQTVEIIITFYSCMISVLCRVLLVFSIPQLSHLGASPELSSGQSSLIECVQTESDGSDHLE